MSDTKSVLNARRIYYLLFSQLFVFTDKQNRYDKVLDLLNIIKQSPLNDECAKAIDNLLLKFNTQNLENIVQEYDDIFHAPPHAIHNSFSFYEEGYETGSACARVRKILAKTKIRRNEVDFKENEDNVGFCFALMQEFLNSQISDDEESGEFASQLFKTIINPNIDDFIDAVYEHENSDAYALACIILQNFIEFERIFYETPKPIVDRKIKVQDGVSRSEVLRREQNRRAKRLERELSSDV
ncbi:molecular chaperone TorD family protein [Campylobacter sp. RM13119]|uniref:TorD/DmsD family molecular chaperone n=1 Tax=Campylobacter TaxID=194 RepID=UPI0014759F59|nr:MULTISPECIES: molecular chaperone TorD family protein [unclassified Campylobacter]MBE3021915.1 molecular chaperone TorD family protein [Campylobacter sp. 7477a]MBE3605980.1 molecular chaperone TorD family protein [Campylobacter sp. RM13119]MBE3609651.1 molecular chaperone TorD family protein [Campylobacter sp. RM12916]